MIQGVWILRKQWRNQVELGEKEGDEARRLDLDLSSLLFLF